MSGRLPRTLVAFLEESKKAFLADVLAKDTRLDKWIVSMGNEAGDLDSLASSVAYAYLSSSKHAVPLILTPVTDLYLRPENLHVLSSLSIPTSDLLTISDLSSPSSLLSRGAKFALVDHNSLLPMFCPSHEEGEAAVTAIIDHHADEGRHKLASPRILNPIGSCSSLVADYFRSQEKAEIPSTVASLLLSAILIDTRATPVSEGGKAHPVDMSSATLLASLSAPTQNFSISSTSSTDDLRAFAKVLSNIKGDVSGLSGRDLIRRDYKAYEEGGWRYGIGTVPTSLKKGWSSTTEIVKDMRKWCESQSLDFVIVSTTYNEKVGPKGDKEKVHKRQLAVFIAPEARGRDMNAVWNAMEGRSELRLEEKDKGEGYRIYQQVEAKATRKVIAPVLREVIGTVKAGKTSNML